MKKLALIFSLAFAVAFILVAGCIPPPSLNPIFTDDDIIFDPDLIGNFIFEESEWTFQKGSGNSYSLTIINEKDVPMVLVAYLGKINDNLFLDVYLDDTSISEEYSDLKIMVVPIHWFWKMKKTGSDWEMAIWNYDWFTAYIEEHPDAIQLWNLIDVDLNLQNYWGPEFIITAPTREIQEFLIKCENIEGVSTKEDTFLLKRTDAKEK